MATRHWTEHVWGPVLTLPLQGCAAQGISNCVSEPRVQTGAHRQGGMLQGSQVACKRSAHGMTARMGGTWGQCVTGVRSLPSDHAPSLRSSRLGLPFHQTGWREAPRSSWEAMHKFLGQRGQMPVGGWQGCALCVPGQAPCGH